MKLPEDIVQALNSLNAAFCISVQTGTYRDDEKTGRMVYDTSTAGMTCHIFDCSFNPPVEYLVHKSKSPETNTVLREALALAIKAEKPMTPAQRATQDAIKSEASALVAEKDKEIEALKAMIAKIKSSGEAPFDSGKPYEPKSSPKTK